MLNKLTFSGKFVARLARLLTKYVKPKENIEVLILPEQFYAFLVLEFKPWLPKVRLSMEDMGELAVYLGLADLCIEMEVDEEALVLADGGQVNMSEAIHTCVVVKKYNGVHLGARLNIPIIDESSAKTYGYSFYQILEAIHTCIGYLSDPVVLTMTFEDEE